MIESYVSLRECSEEGSPRASRLPCKREDESDGFPQDVEGRSTSDAASSSQGDEVGRGREVFPMKKGPYEGGRKRVGRKESEILIGTLWTTNFQEGEQNVGERER